jgi:hypothetical protein
MSRNLFVDHDEPMFVSETTSAERAEQRRQQFEALRRRQIEEERQNVNAGNLFAAWDDLDSTEEEDNNELLAQFQQQYRRQQQEQQSTPFESTTTTTTLTTNLAANEHERRAVQDHFVYGKPLVVEMVEQRDMLSHGHTRSFFDDPNELKRGENDRKFAEKISLYFQ